MSDVLLDPLPERLTKKSYDFVMDFRIKSPKKKKNIFWLLRDRLYSVYLMNPVNRKDKTMKHHNVIVHGIEEIKI